MIAVTAQSFLKNPILVGELQTRFKGESITLLDISKSYTQAELIDFLKPYEVVLCGREKFDAKTLSQLPNLKCISKYGVGLDNLDLKYMSENSIDIEFKAGVNAKYVAEQTLGFMIGAIRNLHISSSKMKSGIWYKNGGTSLFGKTVGIVGLGNVGMELVKVLKPFSCKILINDIESKSVECKEHSLEQTSLQNLLEKSDIVTMHVPLTEKTVKMMTAASFNGMKDSSIFINTCRGEIVDEQALEEALNSGQIAFACADVFNNEPNINNSLCELDNFWPTAHIAGNAKEAVLAMGRAAIDGLETYMERKK